MHGEERQLGPRGPERQQLAQAVRGAFVGTLGGLAEQTLDGGARNSDWTVRSVPSAALTLAISGRARNE